MVAVHPQLIRFAHPLDATSVPVTLVHFGNGNSGLLHFLQDELKRTLLHFADGREGVAWEGGFPLAPAGGEALGSAAGADEPGRLPSPGTDAGTRAPRVPVEEKPKLSESAAPSPPAPSAPPPKHRRYRISSAAISTCQAWRISLSSTLYCPVRTAAIP